MRQLDRGTVVFVNGGTAVRPHPDHAGTSVAFAAESAYGQLLHDALQAENIHVAQLIIPGAITPGDPRKDPDMLADTLWRLHTSRGWPCGPVAQWAGWRVLFLIPDGGACGMGHRGADADGG